MPLPETTQRWSALVTDLQQSGLPIREFAARRDVNPKTLAWWRTKLVRAAVEVTECGLLLPCEAVVNALHEADFPRHRLPFIVYEILAHAQAHHRTGADGRSVPLVAEVVLVCRRADVRTCVEAAHDLSDAALVFRACLGLFGGAILRAVAFLPLVFVFVSVGHGEQKRGRRRFSGQRRRQGEGKQRSQEHPDDLSAAGCSTGGPNPVRR